MIQASHKQSGKFCVACIDSRDLLTAAQRMLPFRRWTVLAAAMRCRESVEFMPGCGCGCAGNLQAACNLWVDGNVLRWRYGMTQLALRGSSQNDVLPYIMSTHRSSTALAVAATLPV